MNILEVWAAFAIVCIGSIEDKLSFIFDLFDFNHQKSISHTEVMVLFGTTLTGITKYARRGEPPDSDTLTDWADHCMIHIRKIIALESRRTRSVPII